MVSSQFGWKKNPFSFRLMSDFFIGYNKEKMEVYQGLNNGDKFALLLGPTGSGKTTFMMYIQRAFRNYKLLFLPKPPKNPSDWIEIFNPVLGRPFPFFKRNISLYNLHERLNKKLGSKRCLVFVDECHEASVESLEWIRSIADQTENLSVMIAGLPVLEKNLKDSLETLLKRVTINVRLTNLTKSETRELIKKRIESHGGTDIYPFTNEVVDEIYEKTAGFPREILRICDDLVKKAVEKNMTTIDINFMKEMDTETTARVAIETVDRLPERQKTILKLLSSRGAMTPNEIADSAGGMQEYKDKGNAIRAMNNILKRLMDDGFVERDRQGKVYVYKVSGKLKTILVTA
ncbi:MAG: AAA family ATPase [Candidatus Aenigmarchaeota archaeon]|nr:AAA family ATPase [Candidatus Aenigmarchaeota archaeon]